LISILQKFFCRQRTLEEVFLRLFWRSSVSILPQILETHHLAPATLIRRQAGESLKISNNSALFRQKIKLQAKCGQKVKLKGTHSTSFKIYHVIASLLSFLPLLLLTLCTKI
jgi:hypothetical protein